MRKVIATIMILAMVILSAGCASSATTTAATTASQGSTTAAGKPIKATLVVRTALGDKSFYDSAWAGLNKAKNELGIEIKAVEIGGDQSKYEPTLIDVSESDADIIFVNAGALSEVALKLIADYPDKKYVLYDMQPTFKNTFSNAVAVSFKQNESSFLAGAVGAKMSKSGKLGFVGGVENIVINDFMVGYINGAKTANPNVKIFTSLIGSFSDTAKGKELALVQINGGADVIHAVAGAAGLGALDAAKEKKIWALGVDSDQATALKETAPETAEQIVTSALKRVDMALFTILQSYTKNEVKWGTVTSLGVKEGVAGIAKNDYFKKNVPADVIAYVEDLEKKIASGEIVVPTSFTMDQNAINDLKNSVKP